LLFLLENRPGTQNEPGEMSFKGGGGPDAHWGPKTLL